MRPAGERPGSRGEVACPECGTPSPAGTNRCPECGFPLVLHSSAEQQAEVDPALFRKPDDPPAGDDPTLLTDVGALRPAGARSRSLTPPAGEGTTMCPACGRLNAAGRRRWCEWCGADMRPPVQAREPVPDTPPPVPHPPDRRRYVVLAAALVTVALIGGVAWIVNRGGDGDDGPPPAAPSATVEAAATVDPGRITARASSTIRHSRNKFGIRNTLDGRDDTAWNSDGRKVGTGRGVTLAYEFDAPVDLRSITVRNGYVRSPERGTRSYRANGRLREVVVHTDGGEHTWNLEDTPEEQTMAQPFGPTDVVRLVVVRVYPGTEFRDLALTDIAFTGVG